MAEEKRFEQKIRKYLDSLGAWSVKYHGNAMSANGTPDLLVCLNGVFMAIEVKATHGRPSELQKYKINQINDAGGVAMVLWPEGFDTFRMICEEVLQCGSHIRGLNAIRRAHSNTKCDIFPKLKL